MKTYESHAEHHVIKEVEHRRGWYYIDTERGTGFGLKSRYVRGKKPPAVGDEITVHTYNFSRIRGVDLRGIPLYYLSDADIEAEQQEYAAKREAKQKREFKRNRKKLDDAYAALPIEFQRRISWFRAHDPDWRWDHEAYEMSVCTDAALIAATLKTAAKIERFRKAKWKTQQAMVPGLYDGHSGNSFGAAVSLARMYVENPLFVIAQHAAISPLVGCEGCGCAHPRPADVMAALDQEQEAA